MFILEAKRGKQWLVAKKSTPALLPQALQGLTFYYKRGKFRYYRQDTGFIVRVYETQDKYSFEFSINKKPVFTAAGNSAYEAFKSVINSYECYKFLDNACITRAFETAPRGAYCAAFLETDASPFSGRIAPFWEYFTYERVN